MNVGRTTAVLEDASASSCARALPAKQAEAHNAGAIAELNRMAEGRRCVDAQTSRGRVNGEEEEVEGCPHSDGYTQYLNVQVGSKVSFTEKPALCRGFIVGQEAKKSR